MALVESRFKQFHHSYPSTTRNFRAHPSFMARILGYEWEQVNKAAELAGAGEASKVLLLKNPHYTGAADKAVNLVGCKSPHHQLPGRAVSISDECGGNDACSART